MAGNVTNHGLILKKKYLVLLWCPHQHDSKVLTSNGTVSNIVLN